MLFAVKIQKLKRVLIITYYWPPAGGSGVQRWLKFSKYLPQYGWQPVIYTPENPDLQVVDESLADDIDVRTEIVTTPIHEPYSLYRTLFGHRGRSASRVSGKKEGLIQNVANVIRSNFFFPDPKCGWIKSSVKFLREYLRTQPVDMIISTGPPHSMHMIALGLTKYVPVPWIADFRDPWTGMFYFKHMKMLPFIRRRHRRMEAKVLRTADCVVAVTDTMVKDFSRTAGDKVKLITNGYDPDDFVKVERSYPQRFSVVHTGLMIGDGNPVNVWKALKRMVDEVPGFSSDFRLRLVGETETSVTDSISACGLGDYLEHVGYIPHSEIVEEQASAAVLLLPLRDEPESGAILTGKFFEYLVSGRPVLAVGPVSGDLGHALSDCRAGRIFEFSDTDGVFAYLKELYAKFRKGELYGTADPEKVLRYSRKELTVSLVEIMDILER